MTVFSSTYALNARHTPAYIVEFKDEPVTTSYGIHVGDHVGVFNITVPPEQRRSGYGRAATQAVPRDGYSSGAHTAILNASEAGIHLYESMGFRVAEYWTQLSG
ncbi:GNAT family N-acetyltransferase [Streptomyces sp. NPDC048473]|uniref:GNAT family N-acetyltransferase n=1 Tax=unclassified Streptomyces TaxID=2593676 RepID=UPI0037181098